MGEKFGRDLIWESHLAEELWNTEIELDIILDEQTMRLSDVVALAPGTRIALNATPDALVQLRCGSVPASSKQRLAAARTGWR